MSDIDVYSGPRNPKVALLTSQLISGPSPSTSRSDPDDLDEEALFAELEAEIENDHGIAREQGIKELQREVENVKQMRADMHGKYVEVQDEKEVIRISANEPRCVIHFYHSNFRRCQIMDKHLATIAPKYFGTRFIRVFVEHVPFLVEKLAIKVLPCVMSFVKGVSKDRIIGFEELGNTVELRPSDKFSTATLELRLEQAGVIQKEPQYIPAVRHTNTTFARSSRVRHQEDDDSDLDL
ncbi:thioredoxin-like protein [Amylostereum chailletii]|nr:thioredoxin-like protein [Amylostereum chailletii]